MPFLMADQDPHLTDGYLNPQESAPKWHLDWFRHFCTAHPCALQIDRQTDRHADHAAGTLVATGCICALQPINDNNNNNNNNNNDNTDIIFSILQC